MMEVDDDDLLHSVANGAAMDYSLWPALLPRIVGRINQIAREEFPIPKIPRQPPILRSSGPIDGRNHEADGAQAGADQSFASETLPSPLPSSPTAPDAPGAGAGADAGADVDGADAPGSDAAPAKSPAAVEGDTEASSQEANKENAPAPPSPQLPTAPPPPCESPPPGTLPKQVEIMLEEITSTLNHNFPTYPPHTFQRLVELILTPKKHYRALPTYLHALDRVVHVTSGLNVYPLPPAVPEISESSLLSNGTTDVLAAPSTWAAPGSDEALGGALLTPIPWLKPNRQESPGSQQGAGSVSTPDSAEATSSQSSATVNDVGAEVRTESTETIDGPNGVGSIETVSISVNGVPSMGARGVGVTQGELLRQEQRAGIVPVSQLVPGHHAAAARHMSSLAQHQARSSEGAASDGTAGDEDEGELDSAPGAEEDPSAGSVPASDDEKPHARGPEEIGPEDMGPQPSGSVGVDVDMQEIDVEAAVGRKADSPKLEENAPAPAEGDEGDDKKGESGESAAGEAVKDENSDKMEVEGEEVSADEEALEREGTPKHKADDEVPEDAETSAKKPKLEGGGEEGETKAGEEGEAKTGTEEAADSEAGDSKGPLAD